MNVSVIGAGAFGTALAVALARKRPVSLWARDPEHAADMNTSRQNKKRLPGVAFPPDLIVSANLETILRSDILLFALPMQALGGFVSDKVWTGKIGVACCKGIDLKTGQGPSALLSGSDHAAVLTGPSFARDIALGLPTALTLACADDAVGVTLQNHLSTQTLRLYRSNDITGAELGGALKNVIAIGCGAVMGAGLGESARAALMTRGFGEMQRVAATFGAQPETLMGLSGLGDLTLTCTSEQSRNYRLGLALGAGTDFDTSLTVEGAATARALRKVARDRNLDLPVCQTIADLVDKDVDIDGAMVKLLARPLKEE